MKKKLFPLAFIYITTLLLGSCSSNDHSTLVDPPASTTNDKIFTVMSNNYYWNVKQENTDQNPINFFNSLLNPEDKYTVDGKERHYSSIYQASDVPSTTFDIGFEYSAFFFEDGKVMYVIDYVKPGTNAAIQNLRRGFLIEEVNGQRVENSNYQDLLKDAYTNGQRVTLIILDPVTERSAEFSIEPASNYQENPIFLKETLNVGYEKLGYLVYNAFNPTYDSYLKNALNEFSGVEYLALDFRYNTGGSQTSAIVLASAIVANATSNDNFLIVERRSDLKNFLYPFDPSINKLSKLKKVYIIVKQITAGMPEAFINGLKPYLNAELIIVGEPTQGRNFAISTDSQTASPYIMNIAIGKWANKNLVSFGSIKPNIEVDELKVLEELGSEKEVMLAAVINNIKGTQTTNRSAKQSTIKLIGSSLIDKSNNKVNMTNITGIDL